MKKGEHLVAHLQQRPSHHLAVRASRFNTKTRPHNQSYKDKTPQSKLQKQDSTIKATKTRPHNQSYKTKTPQSTLQKQDPTIKASLFHFHAPLRNRLSLRRLATLMARQRMGQVPMAITMMGRAGHQDCHPGGRVWPCATELWMADGRSRWMHRAH